MTDLQALYDAGVRSWWPPYDPERPHWMWVDAYNRASLRRSQGRGWSHKGRTRVR